MGGQDIDDELRQEIEGIAGSVDCELHHAQFANNRLQIFLDRPDGGVTLEHCQKVSRQVSALLDVRDFGQKRYFLEVGSPGLDRELFGPRDYTRFVGQLARVTFIDSDGQRQTIVGRLEDFQTENGDAENGVLVVQEEATDSHHRIPQSSIRTARLEIEF